MENQEKTETSFAPMSRILNQYKRDYVLIAFQILCIILFPLGVFHYICGRIGLFPGYGVMFFMVCIFVLFIYFLVSIINFLSKDSQKRRTLTFIEMCLPVLFVFLFFAPYYFKFGLWGTVDPYSRGYSDRIKSQIDIEEVQNWLETIGSDYFTANKNWVSLEDIPEDKLPESLKKYSHHNYIKLTNDKFGNPIIQEYMGRTFWTWGFILGTKDMVYSEDHIKKECEEFGMYLMLVQPGFYVYTQ